MKADHVDVQGALLRCSAAECRRISAYVVQAIRPSWGTEGRRTDVTLFGLCGSHESLWRLYMAQDGYTEGLCVPWSVLPELLEQMELAGWDMGRAIA